MRQDYVQPEIRRLNIRRIKTAINQWEEPLRSIIRAERDDTTLIIERNQKIQ